MLCSDCPALSSVQADAANLKILELGAPILPAARGNMSPTVDAVSVVVGGCAQSKVSGIAASGIVAFVQDKEAIRYRPISQLVC